MRAPWKQTLNWLSDELALTHRALLPERPALVSAMFHVLFEDAEAMSRHEVDPQQRITTGIFARFVAHFLAHGYTFVSPADVLRGLDPAGRYMLLTFDDGYFNNFLALPVLRHYGVPATFFISSHHVLSGQAFWWDVVYRARRRQPLNHAEQKSEYQRLKSMRHPEVEEYLLAQFGSDALRPVGDLDRPFTAAELQAFAREPLVTLGNHTAHHAILTNYDPAAAGHELVACQQHLTALAGPTPQAVAYPNGNASAAVVAAAAGAGLRLGVTVEPGKNYLPFAENQVDIFQLRRFLLWGDQDLDRQCTLFRTDFHPKKVLRSLWRG